MEAGDSDTYSREEAKDVLSGLDKREWKRIYVAVAAIRGLRGSEIDPRDILDQVVVNIIDPQHAPPRRLRRDIDVAKQLVNAARSLVHNEHKRNRRRSEIGKEIDLDVSRHGDELQAPSACETLIDEEQAQEDANRLRQLRRMLMRIPRDEEEHRVLDTKLQGLPEREASKRLKMSETNYASVWKRIKRRLERELNRTES